MGKVPGRADGYATAPVAVINGVAINPKRKHSNPAFYGPGYSIAHPGIFPHNPDAEAWTIRQWLTFDWRAGWGSEAFEERSEDIAALFEAFEEAAAPLGFEAAVALTIIRSQLDARRGSDDASALTKALEVISEQLDDLDGGIENDEAKGAASALSSRIAALAKGLSEHRGTGDTAAAIARLQSSARALGARIASMSGFEAAFEFGRKAAEAAGSAAEAAARRSAMA
ncbi:MAG: hypothetical protein O7G83_05590, partial [Proteobacteria bacterium]|nr:hypothetical protein [Pseudomonadota bacterium]